MGARDGRRGGRPPRPASRAGIAIMAAIAVASLSMLVVGVPVTRADPDPTHSGPWLELDPDHGRAADGFTATYWWLDGSGSCPEPYTDVEFRWDGVFVTTRPFDPVTCSAKWSPPDAPSPSGAGGHRVTAIGCYLDGGDPFCEAAATLTYVVDPTPRLSVKPTEGRADEPFTASYDNDGGCGFTHVQFRWDGALVATEPLDAAHECGASHDFSRAPTSDAGDHAVRALLCEGSFCDESTAASTSYLVLLPPPPTPTPRVTPPPTPPATPDPTPTVTPEAPATAAPTSTVAPSSSAAPTPTPTSPTATATPRPTLPPTGPTSGLSASPSAGSTTPASASPGATLPPTGPTAAPSETPVPNAPEEPSPSPTAAPAAPIPGPPDGGDPVRNAFVPALAAHVAGPDGLSLVADVLVTNLIASLIFVFLFAVTSEIFNSTLDANRDEVHGWWLRLTGGPLRVLRPLLRADSQLARLAESGRAGVVAHAVIVLVLIGLIYGFLSPDFGFNQPSLVLFISLVVAVGFVTYFMEGSTSLLAVRRYRASASVRLYGTAVVVAIVSVIASRLTNFEPGLLYGFVASSLILAPVALGRRDEAVLVMLPALGLLAISVVAWILLLPVREIVAEGGSVGWALVDSILAIVALAGLEGLFLTLIPLRFMDGAVIMAWSRVAWALIFGTVTFLWWQLLLNRDRAYAAAFEQTNVQLVVGVLIVFMITTGGLWSYFRFRRSPDQSPA